MVANRKRITGIAMKLLQIVPRDGTRLYGAMIKKQAEIRKSGRGTFSRAGARKRNAARWTHVRYKGSVDLEPGLSDACRDCARVYLWTPALVLGRVSSPQLEIEPDLVD